MPALWVLGLQPGHDWSDITVDHPTSPGVSGTETILGSGTPTAITSDPDGRYVYILSMDQGIEAWPSTKNKHDGGWHIPHLYVIDLDAGDFTDQTFLESYSANIVSYRLNKLIMHDFVATTFSGFPSTPGDKGEHQLDPRGETRMHTLRNSFMTMMDQDRLYIAASGPAQTDSMGGAEAWTQRMGAVYSLSLFDPTDPTWIRTLTPPQLSQGFGWDIHGFDVVPANGAWIENISPQPRNVLVGTLRDHRGGLETNEQDRLWIAQEP